MERAEIAKEKENLLMEAHERIKSLEAEKQRVNSRQVEQEVASIQRITQEFESQVFVLRTENQTLQSRLEALQDEVASEKVLLEQQRDYYEAFIRRLQLKELSMSGLSQKEKEAKFVSGGKDSAISEPEQREKPTYNSGNKREQRSERVRRVEDPIEKVEYKRPL